VNAGSAGSVHLFLVLPVLQKLDKKKIFTKTLSRNSILGTVESWIFKDTKPYMSAFLKNLLVKVLAAGVYLSEVPDPLLPTRTYSHREGGAGR
jgi:hypothetical protein